MRKFIIFVLTALLLLSLVSCSSDEYICYYGYFTDCAFALIYSNSKNTLYHVNLPLDMIVEWAGEKGMDSVPEVIRDFAGFKESGFMLGNSQTMQALRDILNAMSHDSDPDIKSRLQVIADRSSDFSRKPLLTNMSRLCSCDISELVNALNGKNASVAAMDASVVLSKEDMAFSQKYFRSWINQIIH